MEPMHLIVGLGNPGAEYAKTRHNAGFLLVEKLAEKWGGAWAKERKFSARVARGVCAGNRLLLCEPLTFMNLSGEAVAAVVGYYQLPLTKVMVAVDDADLPLGEIRLRPGGGSGGHHGLDSVAQHLGSKDYARLRIGIGRKNEVRQISGHVLGKFGTDELDVLEKVLERAASQIECWLSFGLQKAMSQFNGAISPSNEAK